MYTWRIDLMKTEPFWKGWFSGLSKLFLSCPISKMLILAGESRDFIHTLHCFLVLPHPSLVPRPSQGGGRDSIPSPSLRRPGNEASPIPKMVRDAMGLASFPGLRREGEGLLASFPGLRREGEGFFPLPAKAWERG